MEHPLGAAPARGPDPQVERVAAVGLEGEGPAVRRPDGIALVAGREGQPARLLGREVDHPEIRLGLFRTLRVDGEAAAVGREVRRDEALPRQRDLADQPAAAVEPEDLRPRALQERHQEGSRRGDRGGAVLAVDVGRRRFLEPPRLAAELSRLGVEAPRHQPIVDRVDQVAGLGVDRRAARAVQEAALAAVERRQVDPSFVDGAAGVGDVQEPAPVGQERGKAVGDLLLRVLDPGRRRRHAAAFGDHGEPAGHGRGEDDGPAAAPASSPRFDRVADRLDAPVGEGQLSQLPLGEEADPPAVGRPERVAGAFGVGEEARPDLVELLDPEPLLPLVVPAHEDDAPAVGGDRGAAGAGVDRGAGRGGDREAEERRSRGRREGAPGEGRDREREQGGDGPADSARERAPRRGGGAGLAGERRLEHQPRLADVAQALPRDRARGSGRSGVARPGGVAAGRVAQSGSRVSTAASTSQTVSPANSRAPVSISKSTTPKAQTSARLSTGLPRACSGDM